MTKKVGVDLSNMFSGAEYSQEVHQLESTVAKLQAEIIQLRSAGAEDLETKLEELRDSLSTGGVLEISLEQIERNEDQPRQTFNEESIRAIARSLETNGQQQPVILIEQPNQRYLIFDGERRWRGAKQLNWATLKAVLIQQPEALHHRVLLANLHRENLNSLDTAEALVKEIVSQSNLNTNDIPRILRTGVRRLERQDNIAQVSELVLAAPSRQLEVLETFGLGESELLIFRILLSLQMNPSSVNANIFPMLALPNDLKEAIQKQGLGGIHALAASRLSAKTLNLSEAAARKVRAKVIKQILQDQLSVSQVRKIVAAEIAHHASTPKNAMPKKQADAIALQVRSLPLQNMERSQLTELREALQQKLKEVDLTLSEQIDI